MQAAMPNLRSRGAKRQTNAVVPASMKVALEVLHGKCARVWHLLGVDEPVHAEVLIVSHTHRIFEPSPISKKGLLDGSYSDVRLKFFGYRHPDSLIHPIPNKTALQNRIFVKKESTAFASWMKVLFWVVLILFSLV